MKDGSRQIVHLGIHWVFAPPPIINNKISLQFQQELISRSIAITNTGYRDDLITIVRDQPIPLRIMVIAPPKQLTGELVIISDSFSILFESFIQETEFIVESFDNCWQLGQRQIVSQDAVESDLYETDAQHAFQEIWETRLKQSGDSLTALGGPVLGGGMRFVIPPQQNMPAQKEIKIESFLRDARKIFIETQFLWPQSMPTGTPFAPREKLSEVNNYAKKDVVRFLSGDKK